MSEILVVAAEASADRYAGKVIKAVKERNRDLLFWGIGGNSSIEAGLEPVAHASQMAIMGLIEVLRHYLKIRRVFHSILARCRQGNVRAALLIDYPGFNFPLMKKLHAMGIPVVYYICPQVWAWKAKRVFDLDRYASRRIVIFPFEVDFFKRFGVDAEYLGHPLIEDIPPFTERASSDPVLALLPGSRLQEIRRHLPLFLEVMEKMEVPGITPRLFPSPTLSLEDYAPFLKNAGAAPRMERSFEGCRAGLVASGTATLEAALHGVPSVVVYRMNTLSALLLRPFVKIDHISIVNILAEKKIFPEFVQREATATPVADSLRELLESGNRRDQMRQDMLALRDILGEQSVTPALADILLEYAA